MLRVSKSESLVGENSASIVLKPLLRGKKYVVSISPHQQNVDERLLQVRIFGKRSPIICSIRARKIAGKEDYEKTYFFVVEQLFRKKLASEVFRKTADFLKGKHELHEALVRSAIPK